LIRMITCTFPWRSLKCIRRSLMQIRRKRRTTTICLPGRHPNTCNALVSRSFTDVTEPMSSFTADSNMREHPSSFILSSHHLSSCACNFSGKYCLAKCFSKLHVF
jgi:hypothetical protein